MEKKKLDAILANHKLWLDSNWQEGRRANLTNADLTGADLTDIDLTGANLTGADLTYADLTGTDVRCAILTGADLKYAIGLEEEQLIISRA